MKDKEKSDAEYREKLTLEQYKVTRQGAKRTRAQLSTYREG